MRQHQGHCGHLSIQIHCRMPWPPCNLVRREIAQFPRVRTASIFLPEYLVCLKYFVANDTPVFCFIFRLLRLPYSGRGNILAVNLCQCQPDGRFSLQPEQFCLLWHCHTVSVFSFKSGNIRERGINSRIIPELFSH